MPVLQMHNLDCIDYPLSNALNTSTNLQMHPWQCFKICPGSHHHQKTKETLPTFKHQWNLTGEDVEPLLQDCSAILLQYYGIHCLDTSQKQQP